MKKIISLLLALVMALGLLAGCGDKANTGDNGTGGDTDSAKKIETLKVAFVPSREPEEIITVTEPLKQMLKDELAKQATRWATWRSPSARPTRPWARAWRPVPSTWA